MQRVGLRGVVRGATRENGEWVGCGDWVLLKLVALVFRLLFGGGVLFYWFFLLCFCVGASFFARWGNWGC